LSPAFCCEREGLAIHPTQIITVNTTTSLEIFRMGISFYE
jgi:hypothetical protein